MSIYLSHACRLSHPDCFIILIITDEYKVCNFSYATSVSILFLLPFQLFRPLYLGLLRGVVW